LKRPRLCPYLEPRATSTRRNGHQSGPIGKIERVGPEAGQGLPPDALSGEVTGVQGESCVRSAGKQPPASVNAARSALTLSLANPLDMLGLTDPDAEVGLKVLGQLKPSGSGDSDPLQNRRQLLGDGFALVVAHRPAGPVDQVQVVGEVKPRNRSWPLRVASK